jgi:hypothetical protein
MANIDFGHFVAAGNPGGTPPASIELEYDIPEGSDAVKEVRKCVEYCRRALTATPTTARR